MTKLEKQALSALSAWLKTGIYRAGTRAEGALLDAAVALEAKRSGKSEREVMDGVLAVLRSIPGDPPEEIAAELSSMTVEEAADLKRQFLEREATP